MNRATHLLPLVLCLFSLRCEESLPPREEPRDFLRATIKALPGPVVILDSVAARTDGGFYIELKNVFDEALQDSALVQARIEVWLKDSPEQRCLAIADEHNLVNGRIVSLGLTTLDVDSAAKFIKQWNHRTNEGIPFWSLVPLHLQFTHGGTPYCESDTMRFVAKASVQVFKRVQAQKTPEIEFSLVYQVFGIQCE